MEGMIASVLLAASTVGISGAMTASFAHDRHSAARQAAILAGRQLLDEVAALPMTATTSGQPSMADYNGYSDSASTAASGSVVASRTTATSNTTNSSFGEQQNTSTSSQSGLLGGVVTSVSNVVSTVLGGSTSSATSNVSGTSTSTTSSSSTIKTTARVATVRRSMSVTRRVAPRGATSSTGDFAVLRINVTSEDGKTTTLTRLVSSAEAQGNAVTQ